MGYSKKLAACEISLALLLLSTVAVHSYQTIISLLETEKWEKPTYKVWKNINDVASKMKDVQRWQGYIITGEKIYLRTYQLEMQVVKPKIKNFQQSIRGPNQKRLLDKLQLLIAKKLILLQHKSKFLDKILKVLHKELFLKFLKYAFALNCRRKIQTKFYSNVDIKLTLIIRNNSIDIQNIYLFKLQSLGLKLLRSLVNKLNGITILPKSFNWIVG